MRKVILYALFLSLSLGAKCGKGGVSGGPQIDAQLAAMLDCAGIGVDDFSGLFSRLQALVNAAAGTGTLPPGLLITGPTTNGVNWSLQIDIDGDGADDLLTGSLTFSNGIPLGGNLTGVAGGLDFNQAGGTTNGSFNLFFPNNTSVRIDGTMSLSLACDTVVTVGASTGRGFFTLEASVPSSPNFIGPVLVQVADPVSDNVLDMNVDFSPGTVATFEAATTDGKTLDGTIDLTTGRVNVTSIG